MPEQRHVAAVSLHWPQGRFDCLPDALMGAAAADVAGRLVADLLVGRKCTAPRRRHLPVGADRVIDVASADLWHESLLSYCSAR